MGRIKQYADQVNVIKRIKVDGKWPFAPVVEKNGKIVRDHVYRVEAPGAPHQFQRLQKAHDCT